MMRPSIPTRISRALNSHTSLSLGPSHLLLLPPPPLQYQNRWFCTPTTTTKFTSLLSFLKNYYRIPQIHWHKAYAIPSTSKWTFNEFQFFKLHYYQVTDPSLLNACFCDNADLTTRAKDLLSMDLDTADIIEGNISLLTRKLLLI